MKRLMSLIVGTVLLALSAAPADSRPDDPASQRSKVADLIENLRGAGKGKLADEIQGRLDRSAKDLAARKVTGHTIYGRVAVEGPDDPKQVQAQMRILEDGYFVSSVGEAGKPIGFRLHGFEPVDVFPSGRPGEIEDAGLVYLRKLDEARKASFKGKVALEGQPDVPEATVGLSIATGPINNGNGGYEGQRGYPIPSIEVAHDGELTGSGYVPTEHHMYVKAPGYWIDYRSVFLQPGQTADVGTIVLELGDLVTVTMMVAKGPSFVDAKPLTVKADAAGGWSVRDVDRKTPYLLFLHKPRGDEIRLRSSPGPFELADLGVGTIEGLAKVDLSGVRLGPERSIPAESGHVYLGRWGFANDWVLFHLEREKLTPEAARRLKPGRS